MKKYFLFLIFVVCSSLLDAKDDPKYPVSAIPENLKQGMYAVVREDFARFEILAVNKSRYYVHKVVTILNEKGKDYASESIGYDKMEKVNSISAYVYDAQGLLIKKLKSNEIIDRSSYDGFSLYSDNRVKLIDLSQAVYPYTVEIEYETEMKYLYLIPAFHLYSDDEVSIQKTSYEVHYPTALKPRYKLVMIEEPKKETRGDIEIIKWSFENIKPEKFETYISDNTIPKVILAPNNFEYGGYTGSMGSWNTVGKWQVLLNEGRGILPEATKQKAKEITKGLTSAESKAKTLYEYLQSRTRYVSIQLGVGGLQPFPATVVDETSYGDCKALSNYMVALLKEVGVKGYYTEIYAGENDRPIPSDFTIPRFNHVIVSVPNGKDTLWMECTSQTKPFGYMGSFTGNRWALMVTEEGGKLVRTPKLKTEQNSQNQKADVFLSKDGNAKAKIVTSYSGLQYENNGLDFQVNSQHDDQKKWLQENISIPSFELGSFSMVNKKDKVPTAIVSADLTLNRYASVSGKRVFLTPNLMNRSSYIPPKTENRKNNVFIKSSFIDVDSITYHIPEEIYPEFIPQPVKISNRYGEYEATFKFDNGKLLYIRKLKRVPGEFPANSYNELIDFHKSINKADNTKIVFLSKT
jgi:transglutaminase-like putative cysteine protease